MLGTTQIWLPDLWGKSLHHPGLENRLGGLVGAAGVLNCFSLLPSHYNTLHSEDRAATAPAILPPPSSPANKVGTAEPPTSPLISSDETAGTRPPSCPKLTQPPGLCTCGPSCLDSLPALTLPGLFQASSIGETHTHTPAQACSTPAPHYAQHTGHSRLHSAQGGRAV